jgi:hypothetical protein
VLSRPTGTRSAESISGSAFHNAFGGLKPRRQPVGSRFFPAAGHRREPALLALAFEAEPALTEFAGNGDTPMERCPSPLRGLPALHSASEGFAAPRGRPPVSPSSLCRGGCHQPYLPPLALRVEKRSVAHRQVLRRFCAPRSVLWNCFAGEVPQSTHLATVFLFLRAQTYVVFKFREGLLPHTASLPSVSARKTTPVRAALSTCRYRCGWTSVSSHPEG